MALDHPLRFVRTRLPFWVAALGAMALGAAFAAGLGYAEHDRSGYVAGGALFALGFVWALGLAATKAPALVLHPDALEWRGQRYPYAALQVDPILGMEHETVTWAFRIRQLDGQGGAVTVLDVNDVQFPRYREIHAALLAVLAGRSPR